MWLHVLAVAVGGAAGAVCRWGVNTLVGPRELPAATTAVNLAGCLLIGLLWPVADRLPPAVRAGVAVGFLGSLTTFSTFALEAATLGRRGVVYVLVSNALGVGLVLLGAWVTRRLQ